jgi:PAS domain S-box-containing protein
MKKTHAENLALIECVNDVIFEIDPQGQILFVNARWQKITGFSSEQTAGQNLLRLIHAADKDRAERELLEFISGARDNVHVFTRLRSANGDFRAIELVLSMIRQDKGQNVRILGTITDLEERRRIERALSEAEKKYRTIVENAAGGIFQMTPEGIFLSANPALAHMLGYEDAEDLLMRVKDGRHEIYLNNKDHERAWQELARNGQPVSYETRVRRKDGKMIWVQERVRCVRDEDGTILYFEGSMEDIQRQKDNAEALTAARIKSDMANRAKSEFLANMSHELRTPLNAIIGFSEILKNQIFGVLGHQNYQAYAQDIYESGHQLLHIISEILDISKIETGERTINDTPISVSDFVLNCLGLIENKIKAHELGVTNTIADVPFLMAEEQAFKQMLMNLLSNAIKFTPRGGHITLAAEQDSDGGLRISVSDTGIGLDHDDIEKALSPFGQLDNNINRANKGTGLGLTLVDMLIRLHGGRLDIFSQKGLGSTMTLVFPPERVIRSQIGAVAGAGKDGAGMPDSAHPSVQTDSSRVS